MKNYKGVQRFISLFFNQQIQIFFNMITSRLFKKQPKQTGLERKLQKSADTTFDISNRDIKRISDRGFRKSIKISSRRSTINQRKPFESLLIPDPQQGQVDQQLLQIFKMSTQVSKNNKRNSFFKLNQTHMVKQQNNFLFSKFHTLFDLYIKEEILKHYCLKAGWKIQKKFLDKYVVPVFDLLAISKDKIGFMFEPFLKQLTSKYILHTQLDTYSRHSPQYLLIQITQVWLRIKKAQIELKRQIRANLVDFKLKYCKLLQGNLVINRNALYDALFRHSESITMVNLIKIFILCYKAQGENNDQNLQEWFQQY